MAVERRVSKIWNSDDLAGSPDALGIVFPVPGSGSLNPVSLYQTFSQSHMHITHTKC
jgi:hypothetical protein